MRTKYRSNECADLFSREEASHNRSAVAEDEEDLPAYRIEELQEALDRLVESGHIEQKRDASGQPVFRPNREGVLQPVWVSTGKPLIDDRDCYVEFSDGNA